MDDDTNDYVKSIREGLKLQNNKVDIIPKITLNNEGDIEIELPIWYMDGAEAYDSKTNEFLGWVNAEKKRIQKYVCKEIVRVKNGE